MTVMNDYLRIEEVAALLKVKPKTIRNKIALGVFTEGVHYFKRKGLGTRFKRDAVVQWMENGTDDQPHGSDGIPMARGYFLREPGQEN